jgi:WbqC-like protein
VPSSAKLLALKRLAIMQSNYIPWKGYFDLIGRVDEFVLLDDVQYTKADWRNRNRIKTPNGVKWLTIPVRKGPRRRRIDEVVVADPGWGARHWSSLCSTYGRAPYFDLYRAAFEPLYLDLTETQLARINRAFLGVVCDLLGIRTPIRRSTEYEPHGVRTERLVDLCRQAGADRYLAVPNSRAYLEEGLFERAGIGIDWMDYSGYREYQQLHGPFEHRVTVLDLLFNVGPDAPQYLTPVTPATGGKAPSS